MEAPVSASLRSGKNAAQHFHLGLVLFAVAWAVMFAVTPGDVGLYDEGLVLTGAMRVGAGELPHRDFFANYGPGQFYALAFLFKLFGPSVIVERLWDAAIKALIAVLCFVMVRRRCRYVVAFASYGLCLLWLAMLVSPAYPLFPALLFSQAALLAIESPFESRPSSVFASGACAGLAFLFRYDVGAVTGFILLVMLAAWPRGDTRSRKIIGTAWIWFLLGAAAVVAPVAVLYLAFGGSANALMDDVVVSVRNYPQMRSLPFPSPRDIWADPSNLIIYFPPMILLLSVLSVVSPRRNSNVASSWLILSLAAVCAGFYLKGWVRVSALHMAGAIVLAIILLPLVWERSGVYSARRIATLACAAVLTIATWFSTVASPPTISVSGKFFASLFHGRATSGPCSTPPHLARMACFRADAAWSEAVRFIADRLPTQQRLFVGLTRHDKILINDNLIYFVAGRLPATRWHHYDPGLQTRADVQADMVRELERQCPRVILLEFASDDVTEANGSAISSGVAILDEYIRSRYALIQRFGTISALGRRDCG
jgi:hypothetical protein